LGGINGGEERTQLVIPTSKANPKKVVGVRAYGGFIEISATGGKGSKVWVTRFSFRFWVDIRGKSDDIAGLNE